MTLLGGTFRFPDGAVVALTGSDFGATLDGASRWRCGASIEVRAGADSGLGAHALRSALLFVRPRRNRR